VSIKLIRLEDNGGTAHQNGSGVIGHGNNSKQQIALRVPQTGQQKDTIIIMAVAIIVSFASGAVVDSW
jgi:hypothetical protein